MHPELKPLGLVAHAGKSGAASLTKSLAAEFTRRSIPHLIETRTAALIGEKSAATTAQLGVECDLLVVLGGDGTILRVLHDLGEHGKPIFGINLGSLGFLTCVNSGDYLRAVDCIAARSYVLSHRTLLHVELERDGRTVEKWTGMNDAVISRGELSRLIRLNVGIDGASLTEYNADGLIVATPTGSTAYSLAAGGPVLTPESGVFVITPICPHVLTNRSLVVGDTSKITIRPCEGQKKLFLTVDGRELVELGAGETVHIRKAPYDLPLAMLPDVSFFEVLRQKLKWSGSAV